MLTKSNLKFLNTYSILAVQFQVSGLDKAIRESIYEGNTEIKINAEKLYLTNKDDKKSIALLYNVDLADCRNGWFMQEMCLAANNLGFLISPISLFHRNRIRECYNAINENLYRAYLDISELDQGIIYLVIDWTEFFKLEITV